MKTALIVVGSALLGAGAVMGAVYWYLKDMFR